MALVDALLVGAPRVLAVVSNSSVGVLPTLEPCMYFVNVRQILPQTSIAGEEDRVVQAAQPLCHSWSTSTDRILQGLGPRSSA